LLVQNNRPGNNQLDACSWGTLDLSTIKDVAREAGVSITTVSHALNGFSDVNETTRQRIIEIAQSLDYYPSAAARSLQRRRTDTVAFAPLLREHIESEPFFKEFLGLLTLSAFRHDLSLLATVVDSPSDSDQVYRQLARSGRADGIIVADIKPHDERIALLRSLGIPFVAFGRTEDYQDLYYPLVDVDSRAGIRAVVGYLVGKGHRRIAYLSGPLNTSYSLYRYDGYLEGLQHHHLPVDERLAIVDLQEQSNTAEAVARLLSLGTNDGSQGARPTAIVAANDHLALQVIEELQDRGIAVGAESSSSLRSGSIAVTGFDDLPFAGHLQPPLTTVRQPIAAIAEILLDLLVSIINNRAGSKKKVAPAAGTSTPELDGRFSAASQGRSDVPVKWIGPMQALVQPELVLRFSA
jgi:DNA-binding LacI/PurR family transcriptional regulator